MTDPELGRLVGAVRRFNRFYTRQIGLLREGLVETPFSLTEARILYEVGTRAGLTATDLGETLDLDAGYMSRLLGGLEERDLLERPRSEEDRRKRILSLTSEGRRAFGEIDRASSADIEAMLERLDPADRIRLVEAMGAIRDLLRPPGAGAVGGDPADSGQTGGRADDRDREPPFVLRSHRSGDMGWVVQRHGELYRREYGWDETFEALVAEIVARFVRELDAERERCWIAERDGERAGSVFLVRHPDRERVARLRLLLVEPSARGLGLGSRLVHECTLFARSAGYRKITLWTEEVLTAARTLYEREGYRRVGRETHHDFGHDLVAETWELEL